MKLISIKKSNSPQEAVARTTQLVSDFRKANILPAVIPSKSSSPFWKPPQAGYLKLNTDAGNCSTNLWRMGAVFRNEEGKILLAISKEKSGCFKPEIIEVMAVIWAMEKEIERGFKFLEVETDSLMLVKAFHGHRDLSALHSLASDIQWLVDKFDYFSLSFVNRTANQVAHAITKHGYNYLGPFDLPLPPGPLLRLAHADYLLFINSAI